MQCLTRATTRVIISELKPNSLDKGCGFHSTPRILNRNLAKLKKIQAKFQAEDGKPMYLKGGAFDRILFTTTMGLALLGTVLSFVNVYELAKPASWRKEY